MKQLFKITFVMACFFSVLTTAQAAGYKTQRTVSKSFPVKENATLKVNHQFGSMTISEWDKEEISIEAVIHVTAKKQTTAEQLVNKVDVRFTEEDNLLLVETKYPNMSNCKCKYSIEYKIFTPKNTTFDLNSTYSSITIDNAAGDVRISTLYGDVSGGVFSGNCHIEATYSNIKIDKLLGNSNIFNSVYSVVNVAKVDKIQVESSYGSYNIEEVNDFVSGRTVYTPLHIKKLNRNFSLAGLHYGKLKIDNVAPQFENITIDAVYAPVEITLSPTTSCSVNASTSYGKININVPQSDILTKSEKRYSTTAIGTIGDNPTSNSHIKISANRRKIFIRQ
ncbi:MAG: DUF4097 family beta strand repeat-containing protein [Bacteroidales bacterium]|nr:DUF4097 family beta strand repeat-containing protein [Bacteroidales bacterium]